MVPSKHGNQNRSMAIRIGKVYADRNNLYCQKIEGYTPSGLGTRSIPVDRMAGK